MESFIRNSPFYLALKILSVLQWFPGPHLSKRFILAGFVSHFILVELYLALQIVNFFFYETFQELTAMMALLPSYIALMVKSFNLIRHSKQLNELFLMTAELLEMSGDAKQIKRRVASADKIFKASLAVATILCLFGDIATANELPTAMWLPFDTKNSRVGYWTAAVIQCTNSHLTCTASLCYDMISIFFLCYAVGFLETLSDNFGKLCEDDRGTSFKDCVKFHWKVQHYIKKILETFSYSWLAQKAMSDLILCNVLYALSTVC